jgi:aspartyl-tRNA(Asn)/glutamyl-tRNA(Gln) amidotransferase subunit C
MTPAVAITREHVQHTASLARLRLSDEEAERLTRELGRILEYIDQLDQVATSGVPPTEHLGLEQLPFRPDEAKAGLSHEQALREAPRKLDEGFAVPAIMED